MSSIDLVNNEMERSITCCWCESMIRLEQNSTYWNGSDLSHSPIFGCAVGMKSWYFSFHAVVDPAADEDDCNPRIDGFLMAPVDRSDEDDCNPRIDGLLMAPVDRSVAAEPQPAAVVGLNVIGTPSTTVVDAVRSRHPSVVTTLSSSSSTIMHVFPAPPPPMPAPVPESTRSGCSCWRCSMS